MVGPGRGLSPLLGAGPARKSESGGILEPFKIRGLMGAAMQRIVWLIQIVAVVGLFFGGFYYWARRQPDPAKRAALLRRAGFGLMALSSFFFGAFIIGDTFADPGGWKAAGLVAAWAVPLAGLAALSWLRPRWAVYVLAALTAAVIGKDDQERSADTRPAAGLPARAAAGHHRCPRCTRAVTTRWWG